MTDIVTKLKEYFEIQKDRVTIFIISIILTILTSWLSKRVPSIGNAIDAVTKPIIAFMVNFMFSLLFLEYSVFIGAFILVVTVLSLHQPDINKKLIKNLISYFTLSYLLYFIPLYSTGYSYNDAIVPVSSILYGLRIPFSLLFVYSALKLTVINLSWLNGFFNFVKGLIHPAAGYVLRSVALSGFIIFSIIFIVMSAGLFTEQIEHPCTYFLNSNPNDISVNYLSLENLGKVVVLKDGKLFYEGSTFYAKVSDLGGARLLLYLKYKEYPINCYTYTSNYISNKVNPIQINGISSRRKIYTIDDTANVSFSIENPTAFNYNVTVLWYHADVEYSGWKTQGNYSLMDYDSWYPLNEKGNWRAQAIVSWEQENKTYETSAVTEFEVVNTG